MNYFFQHREQVPLGRHFINRRLQPAENMTHGKRTCKILKEIRQEIADRNEIAYTTSECHYQGECKGTCPKCEAELKYLENELNRRRQMGKAAVVAGISLGIAGTFAACNTLQQTNNVSISEQNVTANIDTIFATTGIIAYLPTDSVIFELGDVNIFPKYPGGKEARMKFLQENVIYPQEAKEKGIEGKIVVSFVVEIDGSLTNFEVLKNLNSIFEEEALRAAKTMPKWIPGEKDGEPVRVRSHVFIYFKLNGEWE